jgi:hypothetical protein
MNNHTTVLYDESNIYSYILSYFVYLSKKKNNTLYVNITDYVAINQTTNIIICDVDNKFAYVKENLANYVSMYDHYSVFLNNGDCSDNIVANNNVTAKYFIYNDSMFKNVYQNNPQFHTIIECVYDYFSQKKNFNDYEILKFINRHWRTEKRINGLLYTDNIDSDTFMIFMKTIVNINYEKMDQLIDQSIAYSNEKFLYMMSKMTEVKVYMTGNNINVCEMNNDYSIYSNSRSESFIDFYFDWSYDIATNQTIFTYDINNITKTLTSNIKMLEKIIKKKKNDGLIKIIISDLKTPPFRIVNNKIYKILLKKYFVKSKNEKNCIVLNIGGINPLDVINDECICIIKRQFESCPLICLEQYKDNEKMYQYTIFNNDRFVGEKALSYLTDRVIIDSHTHIEFDSSCKISEIINKISF